METLNKYNLQQIYEIDDYLWLEKTIQLLKTKDWENLDIDNLIEELESLGKRDLNKVRSLLRQIIVHLLLLEYWSAIALVGWVERINTLDKTYQFDFLSETQPPHPLLLVGFPCVNPTNQPLSNCMLKLRCVSALKSKLIIFYVLNRQATQCYGGFLASYSREYSFRSLTDV